MVKRMGEIRREYWEAYKEGGPKFEAIKLQFSFVLFYRDTFEMLTDTNAGVPDIFVKQAYDKCGEICPKRPV